MSVGTYIGALKQNFGQYVVRPLNAFGLGGFIFDVEGDTTITLGAEITDHYVEDNTAIQDHIAIRPQVVTLRSYVGEVVHYADDSRPTTLQRVTRKLTTINGYLPPITKAAKQLKDLIKVQDSVITTGDIGAANRSISALYDDARRYSLNTDALSLANATDIWSLAKNLNPPIDKKSQAYMYFKSLMEQKILVSLQTPFEFVNNMAIESITAYESEDSKFIADFSITLKKIRQASTQNAPFDPNKYQSRTGIQRSGEVNSGKTQGTKVDESILSTLTPDALRDIIKGGF